MTTRWILASELWAKTKDRRETLVERATRETLWLAKLQQPPRAGIDWSTFRCGTLKKDGSMVDDPPLKLFYCAGKDCPGKPYKASEMAHPSGCGEERSSDSAPYGYPKSVAIAAVLAAWVSLCPLAPQQAKREAVIAVDPVHAPAELVSRQRAARQAARWGFRS